MLMIVSQAVGFFVQFFPCVLICILPFDSSAFKIKSKYAILLFTLFSAVGSAVFSAAEYMIRQRDFSIVQHYGNLFFLIAAALMLVPYIFLVKENPMKKILSFFFTVNYASLVFVMSNIVDMFNPTKPVEYPLVYSNSFLPCMIIVSVLVFPAFLVFVKKIVKRFFASMELRNVQIQFIVSIFLTAFNIVSLVFFTKTFRQQIIDRDLHICLLHLMLNIAIMLYYWAILGLSVRIVAENQLNKQLEIREMRYSHIKEDVENAKRIQHDTRHFANALTSLLGSGKTDEALELLESFSDKAGDIVFEDFCANDGINSILQYYVGHARKAGIQCYVSAQCSELDVDILDITVILGNLMENAIHSCERAAGQKNICVKIGVVGTFLAMQVDNSCDRVKLSHEYRGQVGYLPAEAYETTREGKGYGLSNVEFAALRYGGSAAFSYNEKEHIFSSRIRLNIESDEEL